MRFGDLKEQHWSSISVSLEKAKIRQTSDDFRGIVRTLSYGKRGVWRVNKMLEDL